MLVLCCYAKRRRAGPLTKFTEQCQHDKFGKFGVRSMRSEESKTLTRLVVRSVGNDLTSSSQCHHNFANTSRSPPPPRCLTNGKTMIVPWNRGKGFAFAPLLASPDSKSTSLENKITEVYGEIVEDDDNSSMSTRLDKSDADFISIDRTTASCLEPKQQKLQRCQCGFPRQERAPRFELPTPSYAPPPLPVLIVRSPRFNRKTEVPAVAGADDSTVGIGNAAKVEESLSNYSVSSLGSPQDSSFSTGSSLDTSASLSDSFCVTSEGEMKSDGKGTVYYFETEMQKHMDGLPPVQDCLASKEDLLQKYILHRIEEESEQTGDMDTCGMMTSRTLDSIKSAFSHSDQQHSQCNIIIPRTTSQQSRF